MTMDNHNKTRGLKLLKLLLIEYPQDRTLQEAVVDNKETLNKNYMKILVASVMSLVRDWAVLFQMSTLRKSLK